MLYNKYAIYLFFFILLFLNACDGDKQKLKKIACIGDSITYGVGINNRIQNSYPAQLENILQTEYDLEFDVENFGVSGATLQKDGDLSYWNQQECDSALSFNPDVVVIMLGTNDSKPWNWNEKEEYCNDFVSLIDRFQELPSEPKIYICNPPPAFKTRWGINDSVIRIDIIPSILKVASIENVKVIDMYNPFIDKGSNFPDFIHPDSAGALLIASTIAHNIIYL